MATSAPTITSASPLTVVIIGLGQMGLSHAHAYHTCPSFRILALINRSPPTPNSLPPPLQPYPFHTTLASAITTHGTPDLVSIATHTDSHASYTLAALEKGCHVFVEKPLSPSVEESEYLITTARRVRKKLVVGYILRHHPSWNKFITHARSLGPPFVFRMSLNQQSHSTAWDIHRRILATGTSPGVDCGVHYIDVMGQITDARPVQVRGMGVRLSEDIDAGQVNYSHLQVLFEDGSIGWYEAGWGPMMSETAWFVKDVVGPKGSISMIGERDREGGSGDVEGHTKTSRLKIHYAAGEGGEKGKDEILVMEDEPGHQELCALQGEYVADVVRRDLDLEGHWRDVVRSQMVVLAADRSMREGRAIDL